MNLDHLAVRARLRSAWESVDLGILLARRHWWQLAALWLPPALAVFVLLAAIFPDSPNLALLFVWWLKPLFERLPLLIASRQLFSENTSFRDALRQFRQANGRDFLAWLLWRRLSFTRSFDMPVTVLENSTGKTRSARLALLHRNTAGTASWVHIVGAHVELIFTLGVAALCYLMIPEQLDINWWPMLDANNTGFQWVANACSLLIMAAVAPFYVCAGFMLYIGRRVKLEAWDIEIHFRKLRARLDAGKKPNSSHKPRTNTGTTLLCALALNLLAIAGLSAPQPALADPVTPDQAQELIDETLAGEDFHQRESVSQWRVKDFESREYHFPAWLIDLIEWLESLGGDDEPEEEDSDSNSSMVALIAGIIEVVLWITAIGLVAFLLWQFRHRIRALAGYRPIKKSPDRKQPETLFGLDVRSESLPDDVTAEVRHLWTRGAQREAVGLLYRATLSNLISRFDCHFRDHHTESECAQLVREEAEQDPRLHPVLVDFFGQLTRSWQQQAYAHRPPTDTALETLCRDWQTVFSDEEVRA